MRNVLLLASSGVKPRYPNFQNGFFTHDRKFGNTLSFKNSNHLTVTVPSDIPFSFSGNMRYFKRRSFFIPFTFLRDFSLECLRKVSNTLINKDLNHLTVPPLQKYIPIVPVERCAASSIPLPFFGLFTV